MSLIKENIDASLINKLSVSQASYWFQYINEKDVPDRFNNIADIFDELDWTWFMMLFYIISCT